MEREKIRIRTSVFGSNENEQNEVSDKNKSEGIDVVVVFEQNNINPLNSPTSTSIKSRNDSLKTPTSMNFQNTPSPKTNDMNDPYGEIERASNKMSDENQSEGPRETSSIPPFQRNATNVFMNHDNAMPAGYNYNYGASQIAFSPQSYHNYNNFNVYRLYGNVGNFSYPQNQTQCLQNRPSAYSVSAMVKIQKNEQNEPNKNDGDNETDTMWNEYDDEMEESETTKTADSDSYDDDKESKTATIKTAESFDDNKEIIKMPTMSYQQLENAMINKKMNDLSKRLDDKKQRFGEEMEESKTRTISADSYKDKTDDEEEMEQSKTRKNTVSEMDDDDHVDEAESNESDSDETNL